MFSELAKSMEAMYRNDLRHDLVKRNIMFNLHKSTQPNSDDPETMLHFATTDSILNELNDKTKEIIALIDDNTTTIEEIEEKNKELDAVLVNAKEIMRNVLIDRGMGDVVEATDRGENPIADIMGAMLGRMMGGDNEDDTPEWMKDTDDDKPWEK